MMALQRFLKVLSEKKFIRHAMQALWENGLRVR